MKFKCGIRTEKYPSSHCSRPTLVWGLKLNVLVEFLEDNALSLFKVKSHLNQDELYVTGAYWCSKRWLAGMVKQQQNIKQVNNVGTWHASKFRWETRSV